MLSGGSNFVVDFWVPTPCLPRSRAPQAPLRRSAAPPRDRFPRLPGLVPPSRVSYTRRQSRATNARTLLPGDQSAGGSDSGPPTNSDRVRLPPRSATRPQASPLPSGESPGRTHCRPPSRPVAGRCHRAGFATGRVHGAPECWSRSTAPCASRHPSGRCSRWPCPLRRCPGRMRDGAPRGCGRTVARCPPTSRWARWDRWNAVVAVMTHTIVADIRRTVDRLLPAG